MGQAVTQREGEKGGTTATATCAECIRHPQCLGQPCFRRDAVPSIRDSKRKGVQPVEGEGELWTEDIVDGGRAMHVYFNRY